MAHIAKIRDIQAEIIKEDDSSHSIACSALGVYSAGKTRKEAQKNHLQALESHLSVIREKATESITAH